MTIRTRGQWSAVGYSKRRISQMHRVLPTVYSSAAPTYLDRCTAVALWKPTAILSHSSAAWLWGLLPTEPPIVEATVPMSAQVRAPSWVTLHRRVVRPSTRHGLSVVGIEQAMLDVAVDMARPELEALFDSAIGTRVHWKRLALLVEHSRGRHGVVAVREQLRTCCPLTRSEPERMVARPLVARGFRLEINTRIGRYYGDLVCRRGRVVIEIDGREFHIAAEVFTNDRIRQNWMIDDDWRVLRYSAAYVNAHLDEVVDEIIGVVGRRRRSRRA
ncbi:hypothetical protein CH289_13985 [Rhodococcus sp. RS1C4]|nr:DUF559 domain-containing protein [Rhodococcus sp. RS1C4]OZC51742.1 hypothetical protein CH289_13985 [Rhodococcus sp. RS1C4]